MSERLLLPEKIYGFCGSEVNIYFANVFTCINPANYVFKFHCDIGHCGRNRWYCIPARMPVLIRESWKSLMKTVLLPGQNANWSSAIRKNPPQGDTTCRERCHARICMTIEREAAQTRAGKKNKKSAGELAPIVFRSNHSPRGFSQAVALCCRACVCIRMSVWLWLLPAPCVPLR